MAQKKGQLKTAFQQYSQAQNGHCNKEIHNLKIKRQFIFLKEIQ